MPTCHSMSSPRALRVAGARLQAREPRICGTFVRLGGLEYYRVTDYDHLRPFLMTVVSAYDHWLFISSAGALTAGRGSPDMALFPYCTVDKLHDASETTGSKTLILAEQGSEGLLWEPFSERHAGLYAVHRALYKRADSVVFEEENRDLGLRFRYSWNPSESFGFVRRCSLLNRSDRPVSLRLMDGLQNLLPYGVRESLQTARSTLVDAYKKSELEGGVGIFALSSIIVDRPEPSEALKATTVWVTGLEPQATLLSSRQVARFRQGLHTRTEEDVRAERGAYLVDVPLELAADEDRSWAFAADVGQGPAELARTRALGEQTHSRMTMLEHDIARGRHRLRALVARSDGLQRTARQADDARHASNTLFNIMRGGLFKDQYDVRQPDFAAFVRQRDRALFVRERAALAALPAAVPWPKLRERFSNPQLRRLALEYLPLSFSRRHGDPSRPWNTFAIAGAGIGYEGNWRDVFQNWEALARSFPAFVHGMIARFANASTADGHNPYRLTHEGMDWEVPDPADPWAHIGYWGDHQIIYLAKLLEIAHCHDAPALQALLSERCFSFADVPYRIRPYEDLLKDPHHTIDFDRELERVVQRRVRQTGTDGKLLRSRGGDVYLATLAEKLLLALLVRVSNLVPGAGIWMNTQRPEWNDANNALVGWGVSAVTLCHVYRFAALCRRLFSEDRYRISGEIAGLLDAVSRALGSAEPQDATTAGSRRRLVDRLGQAYGAYRARVYRSGFSKDAAYVSAGQMQHLLTRILAFTGHAIAASRRSDGLYHSYSLLVRLPDGGLSIRKLHLMLEGQVAALDSGVLSAEESVSLLHALRQSDLYRKDQHSYLLYPDRALPRFADKNVIPEATAKSCALLRSLLDAGNGDLVVRTAEGRCHFSGNFRNAADVRAALDRLAAHGYEELVAQDGAQVLEIFEQVFDHASFTGRSGSFFGYEGLGCIYWHMVSKLLLAIQEAFFRAERAGEPDEVLQELARRYYDVRAGLGQNKTPRQYGAVPTEPYSHTPGHGGARQPGLTGQVKEDIIARWGELGISVDEGALSFSGALLRKEEFLGTEEAFRYVDVAGQEQSIALHAGALGFTYCQVPIVYHLGEDAHIVIARAGASERVDGLCLDPETSASVFGRQGRITRLDVTIWPAC